MNNDQFIAKIESFWEWFTGMEPQYRAFFTEEIPVNKNFLIESMNNRVLDFGKFKWEMGEGKEVKYFLMLSPNGSKELLNISEQIIHYSPNVYDWEFLPAKPSKSENLNFEIYDDFMRLCNVNASDWRFAVSKNRQGLIDLILECKSTQNLDLDTRQNAGESVVINFLGEVDFIKKIGKTVIIDQFENDDFGGIFPIQNLVREISEIL